MYCVRDNYYVKIHFAIISGHSDETLNCVYTSGAINDGIKDAFLTTDATESEIFSK